MQHGGGGLLDVPGGALRGDADLLQLDPDRPAAERGERGLRGAEGDGVHGRESAERPAQQPGERDGRRGDRGLRVGGLRVRGLRLRRVLRGVVGDLAALVAQFGDALPEQVEEIGDGHRAGQLEEGEELGHRLDDLGDGRGGDVGGGGVDEGPRVEEGDPAAQYGGVVAVPGAQPPAGPGVAAVDLDEAGEPGPVPADPDLAVRQFQLRRGAFDVGGGQGARGGGPSTVPCAEVEFGPAGQAYGIGERGPGPVREVGRGGRTRRRPRGGPGAPVRHRFAGRGHGTLGDESESGVASQLLIRLSGRHGSSLARHRPKAQTEPSVTTARRGADQGKSPGGHSPPHPFRMTGPHLGPPQGVSAHIRG